MNDLERLLSEDVARLIDRIATSIPEGMPTLATRISDIEQRLAAARMALLDDYARWQQTLRDAEDICALAAWRTAVADEPVTAAVPIAA